MNSNKNEVKDLVDKIEKADRVIIYGAMQKARDMLPVCETFAGRDKIGIVTTQGGGELEGYKILSIKEAVIEKGDVILVAMAECYFDEIRRMPQIEKAGSVVYLNDRMIKAGKLYAIRECARKFGIDFRLFYQVAKTDLLGQMPCEPQTGDINSKIWELATEETAQYVIKNMRNVKAFQSRDEYHLWLKDMIKENQTEQGINFEFGVAQGRSLRTFAGAEVNKFYGFDSFEGLPEGWLPEFEKGIFKTEKLPWVPANVELIKGWFDDVLPTFVTRRDIIGRRADFIHIDCDLYRSAKTVFENIAPFIKSGTIIAFDEYFNYPGWQMDEFRAFHEFVETNRVNYEYLAYVSTSAQVCIKIV